jgi:hypothetical protein
MTPEQIENTFTYHAPFGDQTERYNILRTAAKGVAIIIENLCPESREKSLAFTNLQQCIMWANASIAINEVNTPTCAGCGSIMFPSTEGEGNCFACPNCGEKSGQS